ncbi:serine hydrolase domain-containing protein [Chryseobacterium tructae]|uniref:Serine hydrolase domain-containing protein n=1 Tax=Chryseobacterium tructae TaxID=1037380 RepID=A0ABV7XTC6_9FLAO|nr:serine hydrolase domain-containing protein [Chryseobacterium tructae]MDN3691967.1 serine hydrolase domain-containing protein [Chryseobacterium tructae]
MHKILIPILLSLLSHFALGQTQKVKQLVENYASEHQFNGTVLIQKDSKTIYHKSFGVAERSFNSPTTNDTRYQVCSITKTFTAVLILQLVDQGKIDLNKKILDYLPDYKGEGGSKVSIRQLLNHTSGMKNTDTARDENFLKYGLGFYNRPYELKEIVNQFCSNPLVNEPGTKFDYNNGEYMILGRILEVVYQMTYEEILSQKILVPLKMNNSGLISHYKLIKNLATPYYKDKNLDHLIPNIPIYVGDFSAAGAMYSCTSDLIKFNNALFDDKLIKKETLNQLLTPGLDDYGYSVWIRDIEKYKRMERYGRIAGANCVWFHYLNNGLSIIILSNTNLTDLGDYASKIGKAIL